MLELIAVNAFYMRKVPEKDVNISHHLDIDKMLLRTKAINYYKREKNECPLGRGNWVLDIIFLDNDLICIKYPLEMTESHFMDFIKPLLDAFNQKRMH